MRSLVAVAFSVAYPIAPAIAAPASSPLPSSPMTTCSTPSPEIASDFETTFADDLASPAIQRLVALLGSASPEAQADVVKRASAAARSPERAELRAALAKVCPEASDVVGFSRGVAVISHYWNTPELENEKSADDLTAELQTAVSALAHPDALTPEQRSAAAAPFEALASAAPPPQPSATGSAGCANQYSPAQPVAIAPLTYPVTALTTRSAGTILVKVTLSETGGVRSATLFKQTGDGAGSDALVDAAIISAAATTYRPDLERCVPSGGSYLFKADFILRK